MSWKAIEVARARPRDFRSGSAHPTRQGTPRNFQAPPGGWPRLPDIAKDAMSAFNKGPGKYIPKVRVFNHPAARALDLAMWLIQPPEPAINMPGRWQVRVTCPLLPGQDPTVVGQIESSATYPGSQNRFGSPCGAVNASCLNGQAHVIRPVGAPANCGINHITWVSPAALPNRYNYRIRFAKFFAAGGATQAGCTDCPDVSDYPEVITRPGAKVPMYRPMVMPRVFVDTWFAPEVVPPGAPAPATPSPPPFRYVPSRTRTRPRTDVREQTQIGPGGMRDPTSPGRAPTRPRVIVDPETDIEIEVAPSPGPWENPRRPDRGDIEVKVTLA